MQIAPKGLNHIAIKLNYKKTLFKNVKKAYLNQLRYIKKKTMKKHNVNHKSNNNINIDSFDISIKSHKILNYMQLWQL